MLDCWSVPPATCMMSSSIRAVLPRHLTAV